jgi:hypothetical protein
MKYDQLTDLGLRQARENLDNVLGGLGSAREMFLDSMAEYVFRRLCEVCDEFVLNDGYQEQIEKIKACWDDLRAAGLSEEQEKIVLELDSEIGNQAEARSDAHFYAGVREGIALHAMLSKFQEIR